MSYTTRHQAGRVVTPLAHVRAGLPSVVNPGRFNGVRYTVAALTWPAFSGQLAAAPMIIPAGTSFDEIGVNCFADAIGVAARMGLYHNDETHGGPGRLLAELGRFPTHLAGFNSLAIDPVTVWETALYWLVLLAEGSVTYNAFRGGGLFTGGPGLAAGNQVGWGYWAAGIGVNLPDPISPSTMLHSATGPHMVLRCHEVPSMTMPIKRARRSLRHQPMEGEDQMMHIRISTQASPLVQVAVPQDRMFLYPMVLHEPTDVLSLTVAPTIVGTNPHYVVIYESRPDNMPGQLLFSASLDVTVLNPPAATTTLTLGPGFYWVGVHHKGAGAPTLAGYRALGDALFALSGGNYPSAAFYVDDPAATPSDPFNLALARTDSAIAPLVVMPHTATGRTRPNALSLRRFVPAWPHVYAPDFWVGPSAAPWTVGTDKVTFTANSWAMLWVVDRPTTYDQISIEFAAGGLTNTDVNFGIYEDKGYRPGRLLRYLTGVIPITTAGRIDFAIDPPDLRLMPGYYWIAIANMDIVGDDAYLGTLPAQSMDIRGGTQNVPYWHFQTSRPLPDPWPLWTDPMRDGPALWMRVKHHA